MRVNEENFATGDAEDIKPSYVEQVIGNHNIDEGAHPDIRKQISETQAFYQSTKVAVSDAEASVKEASGVALDASKSAENAANEAKNAEERIAHVVSHPCYIGENKNWFVFDQEAGVYVDSGICAKGEKGDVGVAGVDGQDGYTPIKGSDYWTAGDKAEIKSYIEEAILGGAW